MKKTAILASALHWVLLAILFLFLILATSCEGKRGRAGLPGADADDGFERVFARGEALPGLNVESLRILGASLPDGSFRPGDPVQVEFKVTFDDGTEVPLEELDSFSMYVAGPTYHYQQVIQRQRDIADVAVMLADGTYRYQFPGGMPAVFAPPLNDTDDLTEGEWTGQDLVPGTYTLGLELYRLYEYGSDEVRDATNATLDFSVLGGDGSNGREVVTRENCNQCHGDLRVHGTFRLEPKLCVLCHTAGAEDGNDPDVEGGTPGRTIDFKVMIHKIHAGHSLPSVQGMTTDANGDRDYSVPGVPYKLLGFGSSVHDYSEVVWPQWPSLAAPMPRDVGYGALGSDDQSKENAVRSGPVQCAACHGDPDGDGELPAPIHGDLAFTQPTRAACGSCHTTTSFGTIPTRPTSRRCLRRTMTPPARSVTRLPATHWRSRTRTSTRSPTPCSTRASTPPSTTWSTPVREAMTTIASTPANASASGSASTTMRETPSAPSSGWRRCSPARPRTRT